MYALIVCMQVFWVYVFFICIIITSFFRISVFSFNIRLIFFVCYQLLLARLVPQSSSSLLSKDEWRGNESDKSFAGGFTEMGSQAGKIAG